MNKKKFKDLTPDDIINPSIPDKMPELSRRDIQIARDKLKAKQTKQLHELAKQKQNKMEDLSKKFFINMDMMRSPETLAKEIIKLEESIKAGNKSSIRIKKKVIEAKSELEKLMLDFDKKKEKFRQEYRDSRQTLNDQSHMWMLIRLAERNRNHDQLRATTFEVDELISKVKGLETQVKGYRLDRHLVAQVENLKVENQMMKGQLQKVFQMLKQAGIGR